MLFGSVRSLVPRSFSSWSNLPLGIARGSRVCSSLCVPAENTKHSVTDLALNSVVKVFCCSSEFSVLQPWQKRPSHTGTGSGFVISRNKILTNAHVVSDHTFVQVRKHGSPEKYKAKVEAIGHECDLAILKINDKKFWEDMKPLELGDIPTLHETVSVVGYPEGGDNISVTKGVVSRVEVRKYSHGGNNLVTVQIDAAINKGNSGGPVVMENKVVGVAFQGLASAENSGYIIPTPVIKHFINGVKENGKFVGFCSLGISCQSMENPQLRDDYKMSPEMSGVLILRINPLSSAYNILKEDDILLSIDGVSIKNDETVQFRKNVPINFNHLVSMKKPGETALVKVLREGKQHEFNIKLMPVEPLIPLHQYDKVPSYYIFAGLVFSPLTKPYMDCCKMYKNLLKRMPEKAGQQIIIISNVLEDDINVGYPSLEDLLVKKVNGVEVENLRHLSQLIENCCTEKLRLELTDRKKLVVDYKSAKKRNSTILKRYGIPSAMSKDLKVKKSVV